MRPRRDTAAPGDDVPTQDRLIAAALIEDIVEWRIKPGTWIREREIAQFFGVSHAPVREAFRHVANIGFIQLIAWRGAHVIEIDRHPANEVLELCKALSGVVSRLTLTETPNEDEQARRDASDRCKNIIHETADAVDYLAASNRISRVVAEGPAGLLGADMLDRVALFAHWHQRAACAEYAADDALLASSALREVLLRHVIARKG